MKKIFLFIAIGVLTIFGLPMFVEFMANHSYYKDMFASWDNRKILIWAILSALIPLYTIVKAKKFSLKKLFVWQLPLGLLVFSIAMTIIKEGIVG